MTKRRAVDSDHESPAPKKTKTVQSPPSAGKTADMSKKGRGRPTKKGKKLESPKSQPLPEEDSSKGNKEGKEGVQEALQKSPPVSNEPRVLLSPADKQVADKKLFMKKQDADQDISESTPMDITTQNSEESTETCTKSKSPKKSDTSEKKQTPSSDLPSSAAEESDLPDLSKKRSPKKQSPIKMSATSSSSTKNTETPSDILARKLSKEGSSSESEKMDTSASQLKDFVSALSFFIYVCYL